MLSHINIIDIVILGGFLLATLYVGLRTKRNVENVRDYAIGRKDFSTPTITATIVATWIGGGFMFYTLEQTYSKGLHYIIALLGASLGILLNGIIGARMGNFLHHVSVAEVIRAMYGKATGMVTAVSGILSLVGGLAIQFKVIAKILALLLAVESSWVPVMVFMIIVLYASLGGIRSVTFTDVVQFATFGVFIPVLALTIWGSMEDGPSRVAHTITTNPYFSLKEVVRPSSEFMATLGLFAYFAIPGFSPALFQRMAMARDAAQVKRSFTYATGLQLMISAFLVWVGVLLLADKPGMTQKEIFPYLVDTYAHVGLRGLFSVGVIAMAMSTADSCLNAAAVMAANDVAMPLHLGKTNPLRTVRLSSWVIGILALVLALLMKDLLNLVLLSGSFYMPVIAVPMLLTAFGFKSSKRVILLGIASGVAVVAIFMIFLKNVNSIVPGMLINLAVTLGAHYLLGEEGGWGNNPITPDNTVPRKPWKERLAAVRRARLYTYLEQVVPKQEYFYSLFGFYILTVTYLSYYLLPSQAIAQAAGLHRFIQYSITIMGSSYILFPLWPKSMHEKNFLIWTWPASIFYTLFFVGSVLAIAGGFELPHLFIWALNLVMAVLMLTGSLVLGMAVIGVVAAMGVYMRYPAAWPSDSGSLHFKIIYGLLLCTSFLIALFKHKQAYQKLEQDSERLARDNSRLTLENQTASQELLEAFKEKLRLLRALKKAGVQNISRAARAVRKLRTEGRAIFQQEPSLNEFLQQLSDTIMPMATELEGIEDRATAYLRLNVKYIALPQLLEQVATELKQAHEGITLNIQTNSQYTTLECDPIHIKSLLLNSIKEIHKSMNQAKPILLALEDTQLDYSLPSVRPGYIKKVAALGLTITTEPNLPPLSTSYTAPMISGTALYTAENTQAMLLAKQLRIVKAHYGYTNLEEKSAATTQRFVIPVALYEVRPADTDKAYMELGADLVRADDQYPGAQMQEQKFLQAVSTRTQANLESVVTAIEMIKWYHGPMPRKTGEPFYLHPLAVAQIVLDYNAEAPTVMGALLHDTVEDTPLLLETIAALFGQDVARIVDRVTHLESYQNSFYKVRLSAEENILMLLEAEDRQALCVKVADRMHNMRTIHGKSETSQRKTAKETLQFFVPLAEKLGLKKSAHEFKERSMEVLNKTTQQAPKA